MSATPTTTRRLAAIVVADVVGYSRLLGEDEAGTLAALRERRKAVVEPLTKQHSGRVVKFLGDGVLIEFSSAVNAVAFALDLQRRMVETNEPVPEVRRIQLRVGINLGEVVGDGADIFGDGVNIAARLEALAEPGGICVSAKVQEEVAGKLSVGFLDLGQQQLKNIARPVRAFRLSLVPTLLSSAGSASSYSLNRTAIAVLPFTNMSGDASQEYFADGVTEDIITELSRYRHFAVLARNSTFVFKGKAVNVAEIGRQLQVDFVLEGSIRLVGQRVRATVQLIDVDTGVHAFADRFDRDFADIFAVQDEIVASVLTRLAVGIDIAAGRKSENRQTSDLTAYQNFLRARAQWLAGNLEAAAEHCKRAISLDPSYARALATLGHVYAFSRMRIEQLAPLEDAKATALKYLEAALASDDSDAVVLQNVAAAYQCLGEVDTAQGCIDRAFFLNPNDPEVALAKGFTLVLKGLHQGGIQIMERVLAREKGLPPGWFVALADGYYLERDYAKVVSVLQEILGKTKDGRVLREIAKAQLGHTSDARSKPDWPTDEDLARIAHVWSNMYALPEDRLHILDGFRKIGVHV